MTAIAAVSVAAAAFTLTGLAWARAWQRVQFRRTDNWLTINRENVAANRAVIRDTLRNQADQ